MSRACTTCQRNLDRSSFSGNQWKKGPGASRCNGCVHGGGYGGGYAAGRVTERTNGSHEASFKNSALDHPFSEGAFRWVAKGTYVGGERAGEAAVTKWFKSGHHFEAEFFDLDIKAQDKAIELMREFNNQNIIGSVIRMNKPEVWTFEHDTDGYSDWAGRKTLTEPFIENWQKFNSNTGWTDGEELSWGRVMQAVSHFSYHASGGQFVLCDLQGGVYRDGAVLTDPVILSRSKLYGLTDLGPTGISSFFSRHVCNEFCRSHWSKPRDQHSYHRAQAGTSMVGGGAYDVPDRTSRPYMSGGLGALDESDDDDRSSSSSSSSDY